MCLSPSLPHPTDCLQASLFNTGFQQLNYVVAWGYWFFCLFVVYPSRLSEFLDLWFDVFHFYAILYYLLKFFFCSVL